jgi:hypothetical protein
MNIAPIRRCSVVFRHRSRVLQTSTKGTSYFRLSRATWNGQYSTFAPISAAISHLNTSASALLSGSSSVVSTQRHFSSRPNVNMTNKIVARNGGRQTNNIKTLYDPSRETENCGVGLIASLKSIPSRDIVLRADEMLVRMAHRGGCGCDPASGDGSGACSFYLFFHFVFIDSIYCCVTSLISND